MAVMGLMLILELLRCVVVLVVVVVVLAAELWLLRQVPRSGCARHKEKSVHQQLKAEFFLRGEGRGGMLTEHPR